MSKVLLLELVQRKRSAEKWHIGNQIEGEARERFPNFIDGRDLRKGSERWIKKNVTGYMPDWKKP